MRTHYITMEEATLRLLYCFNAYKIKFRSNKNKEQRVEIDFEDPDTLDIIEFIGENGKWKSITITSYEAIDEYLVKE